jgi:hypothetical protein
MAPDVCPECDESHGYTFVRCDDRCRQFTEKEKETHTDVHRME